MNLGNYQRNKVEVIKDRIKVVENTAEAAKIRAMNKEEEVKQLQKKLNNSNLSKTVQELNTLKIQMEEMKQQLQKETAEKNDLMTQRDEYQNAAKKLVSATIYMTTNPVNYVIVYHVILTVGVFS